MSLPLFSIAHTTARPERWRASYDSWIARAVNPEQVEYILCCDEKWGFVPVTSDLVDWLNLRNEKNALIWNEGPKSSTSGWNRAAVASTGGIIILNADDMRPPHGWDKDLLRAIAGKDPLKDEFVVHVACGGTADQRGLIILQILSRARYERLGYALFPLYESMYSDDEFTLSAQLDGCYIDARHLRWNHGHPFNNGGDLDEVYRHQNRPQAYETGRKLFEERRAAGFPPLSSSGSSDSSGSDSIDMVRPSEPISSLNPSR